MNSGNIGENYKLDVVQAGDQASGNFREACNTANEEVWVRKYLKNTGTSWEIEVWGNWVKSVIESIDGVGTKVQIYTRQFENYIQAQVSWEITDTELLNASVELWERMLHDLIAMNVDDFRNWEMAVVVTNIIDINHLKWARWKVFADSMAIAMWNVISEVDIAITAWETAVLWEPKKVNDIMATVEDYSALLIWILEGIPESKVKNDITTILDSLQQDLGKKLKEIEFNIGGTGLGIQWYWDKFVPLWQWQKIICFQEKPTESWIIGPRSNGITAIRKHMIHLLWENWENKTFEEFLEQIGEEKTSQLSDTLKEECKGLKMWDIATGKTTVFNPFISRNLLWWVDDEPKAKISSLIHVTGNPWRKIIEWLRWAHDLRIILDLANIKLPQIVEILQVVSNISDQEAMDYWNMWIPYIIICEHESLEIIQTEANKAWFMTHNIWCLSQKNIRDPQCTLFKAGIWKSNIIF